LTPRFPKWLVFTRIVVEGHSGTVINTAYIERLNAPFRASTAPLTRRTRALAHRPSVTEAAAKCKVRVSIGLGAIMINASPVQKCRVCPVPALFGR